METNTIALTLKYVHAALDGIADAKEKDMNSYDLIIKENDSYTLRCAIISILTGPSIHGLTCTSKPGIKASCIAISWPKVSEKKLLVEREAMEVVAKYHRIVSLGVMVRLMNNLIIRPDLLAMPEDSVKSRDLEMVLPIADADKKWKGMLRDVFCAVGFTNVLYTESSFTLSWSTTTKLSLSKIMMMTPCTSVMPDNAIQIKDDESSKQAFFSYIREVNCELERTLNDPKLRKYYAFDIQRDSEWKDVLVGVFSHKGYKYNLIDLPDKSLLRIVLEWDIEFPRRSTESAATAVLKYLLAANNDAREQIKYLLTANNHTCEQIKDLLTANNHADGIHMCRFNLEANDREWTPVIRAVFHAIGFAFVEAMEVDKEGNMPITIINQSQDPVIPRFCVKANAEEYLHSKHRFINMATEISGAIREVRKDKKRASMATYDIKPEYNNLILMGLFSGLGIDCLCVPVADGMKRLVLTWDDPAVCPRQQKDMKEKLAHPEGKVIRIRARPCATLKEVPEVAVSTTTQPKIPDSVLPTSAQMKEKLILQYVRTFMMEIEKPFKANLVRVERKGSIEVRKDDEDILPELREIFISKGYDVEVSWRSATSSHSFTVTW